MTTDAPPKQTGERPELKSGMPEYKTWGNMMNRCTNSKRSDYHRYGGRGITVCNEWRDFWSFYDDMGPRPEGGTLERINNDGNYDPDNCRWATRAEQSQNLCHSTAKIRAVQDNLSAIEADIKAGVPQRTIADKYSASQHLIANIRQIHQSPNNCLSIQEICTRIVQSKRNRKSTTIRLVTEQFQAEIAALKAANAELEKRVTRLVLESAELRDFAVQRTNAETRALLDCHRLKAVVESAFNAARLIYSGDEGTSCYAYETVADWQATMGKSQAGKEKASPRQCSGGAGEESKDGK